MPQRKKKSRVIDRLIVIPWRTSMLVGLAMWLILFVLIPVAIAGNPSIEVLQTICEVAAWLVLLFFAMLAAVSFVRKNRLGQKQVPPDVYEEAILKKANKRRAPEPVVIDQDMHTVLILGENTTEIGLHWSIEALRSLEWKRFELLCAKCSEVLGFKAETQEAGTAMASISAYIDRRSDVPIALIRCKSWKSQVLVSEIHELFDVMAQEKVARGIFITTGSYTRDARMFGATNPIQLLDGDALLKKIMELEPASRNILKTFAFEGDYTTPTCASCGIKLVRRENRRSAFWGCINYPRCHTTLKI